MLLHCETVQEGCAIVWERCKAGFLAFYEVLKLRLPELPTTHSGVDWASLPHRNLLAAGFYDWMLERLQDKDAVDQTDHSNPTLRTCFGYFKLIAF